MLTSRLRDSLPSLGAANTVTTFKSLFAKVKTAFAIGHTRLFDAAFVALVVAIAFQAFHYRVSVSLVVLAAVFAVLSHDMHRQRLMADIKASIIKARKK